MEGSVGITGKEEQSAHWLLSYEDSSLALPGLPCEKGLPQSEADTRRQSFRTEEKQDIS